jgi:putative selenium metabolism protein SsnA
VSRVVLAGGTVVASLSPARVLDADVSIERGRILDVSSPAATGDEVIDCRGCVVLPGSVCAHHHLYSTLARGMPFDLEPPRNFTQILQRVWWRLDRALDPTAVWWSAWAGAVDALLAGTTTIVDHHASPGSIVGSLDQIGAAISQAGARGILCYEVTDRDGPERAEAGLEETRRFAEHRGKVDGELLRAMVGAHASFTLSDRTLAGCVDAARDLGVGVHVHVAEDEADQRDCLARTGARVVRRLAEAGALDERALLAHCIHLDDDEFELLNASGATAVTNPRSNMNNGVGHARVDRFERLAIGTDGIGGDLFAEAQAGYWRGREADPDIGPQWALDRLASSARLAAAAFGEPQLGTIQEGAPADVVVLDYVPPTPLDERNLAGHAVFGLSSRMVRDVFVAGERVVRDRRLVRAGPEEPSGGSAVVAERLWHRMRDIEEHPFTPVGA